MIKALYQLASHWKRRGFLRNPTQSKLPLGWNVSGHFDGIRGVAAASAAFLEAAKATGFPVALNHPNPYAVNLVTLNTDSVEALAQRYGESYFAGRCNIGVWFWETPELPERLVPCLSRFHELWVTSAFCRDAIQPKCPCLVQLLPYPFTPPQPDPTRTRATFGLPDDATLFLTAFDYDSNVYRKNPEGTIRAFAKAFSDGERGHLAIKTLHSENHSAETEQLHRATRGLPVTFLDRTLALPEQASLLSLCDAFVSLHRAEGFGLHLLEALALGKPVVATGWSGNTEFLSTDNSLPVDFTLQPLTKTLYPYEAGQLWAEPDIDHAARRLRFVYDFPDAAQALGEKAKAITELHSVAKTAAAMRARLEALGLC
ncbi:glycosyltransferase family 4 protein [Armatimonas sp.]|uniref:glycosyltransferase family 4 protein n=1 Tax=Armatimonas sp. TaxID=1872638 RepID=UPI0037500B12